MATTRTTHAAILAPEQVGDLIVRPVVATSVAGQALEPVTLTGTGDYRIPVVTADPSAAWVLEGQEIPVTDSTVDEVTVRPPKLAGLSIISRELAEDSSPEAQQVVGDGLVRDLTRKLDQALFANTTTNGPSGLLSLSGIIATTAATMDTVVDAFIGATYSVEANNGHIQTWVANPATAARISALRKATGSNEPLLGNDVTQPGARQLLGAPLITSPYVAANVIWGIDPTYSKLVIREAAEVLADSSVFFTSDRVAVRGILRAGFAFAHTGSIAKVTIPSAS